MACEPKYLSVCRARQSKSAVQGVTCGGDSRSNPEPNESDEVQPTSLVCNPAKVRVSAFAALSPEICLRQIFPWTGVFRESRALRNCRPQAVKRLLNVCGFPW